MNHSAEHAGFLQPCSLAGLADLQFLSDNAFNVPWSSVVAMQAILRCCVPTPQETVQEDQGPVNHFASLQLVPFPKHCFSVIGFFSGLQNSSLPSAQATCLVLTPWPHSAEHSDDHSEYSQGARCSVIEGQEAISQGFSASGLLDNGQASLVVMQVTVRLRIPRPQVVEQGPHGPAFHLGGTYCEYMCRNSGLEFIEQVGLLQDSVVFKSGG